MRRTTTEDGEDNDAAGDDGGGGDDDAERRVSNCRSAHSEIAKGQRHTDPFAALVCAALRAIGDANFLLEKSGSDGKAGLLKRDRILGCFPKCMFVENKNACGTGDGEERDPLSAASTAIRLECRSMVVGETTAVLLCASLRDVRKTARISFDTAKFVTSDMSSVSDSEEGTLRPYVAKYSDVKRRIFSNLLPMIGAIDRERTIRSIRRRESSSDNEMCRATTSIDEPTHRSEQYRTQSKKAQQHTSAAATERCDGLRARLEDISNMCTAARAASPAIVLEGADHIERLPPGSAVRVLTFLDVPSTSRFACTSWHLNRISDHSVLWNYYRCRDFGNTRAAGGLRGRTGRLTCGDLRAPGNAKNEYRSRLSENRNASARHRSLRWL